MGEFWQAMAFLSQPAAIVLGNFAVWGGRRIGFRDNGECNFVGRHPFRG
jgi:hypothetical protein